RDRSDHPRHLAGIRPRFRAISHAALRRGDGRHHDLAPARVVLDTHALDPHERCEAMSALLQVESLTMRFGGLLAIDQLSFAAEEEKITAVIGPNGAGKTTVFNCLTGFYRPTSGSLSLHRGDRQLRLERMDGWRIARDAGIARTFQNIRLFAGMTVLENLIIAQHKKLMRASGWSIAGLLGLAPYRSAERAALERAAAWLERIGLLDRADQVAGTLPYGDQRRLEIARAMCTEPVLLCLDE